jgi:phage gp36-like protein
VTYATQADLVSRFGETELAQLTDRASGAAIDAAVVTRALQAADNKINGYLAARYSLPLATVPELLKDLAGDIARHQLYEDRVTDIVQKRYDDAIEMLKDISTGKASLGLDSEGDEEPSTGGPEVASGGPGRTFSKGNASTGVAGTLDDYTG